MIPWTEGNFAVFASHAVSPNLKKRFVFNGAKKCSRNSTSIDCFFNNTWHMVGVILMHQTIANADQYITNYFLVNRKFRGKHWNCQIVFHHETLPVTKHQTSDAMVSNLCRLLLKHCEHTSLDFFGYSFRVKEVILNLVRAFAKVCRS